MTESQSTLSWHTIPELERALQESGAEIPEDLGYKTLEDRNTMLWAVMEQTSDLIRIRVYDLSDQEVPVTEPDHQSDMIPFQRYQITRTDAGSSMAA